MFSSAFPGFPLVLVQFSGSLTDDLPSPCDPVTGQVITFDSVTVIVTEHRVFHDLRSPLQVVLGWARQLKSPSVSPEVLVKGLESIERSAELQTRILDDLLDLYRFSVGKATLDLKPVDLSLLVRLTCDSLHLMASNKKIHLYHELPDTPLQLMGDLTRLQQILWNLISNAIKFTPSGGWVRISGEIHPTYLRLEVKDSGKGIDPAFLPYIFDAHTQESNSSAQSKTSANLGLGLAIVQRLVELHRGRVWAESPGTGCGATFIVEIPTPPQS